MTEQLHLPTVNGFLDDLAHALHELVEQYGWQAVHNEILRHQPAVPAASAPARATDPETSHLAAKTSPDLRRFSARSSSARLLKVFMSGDFTDQQAASRVVGIHAAPSAFEGCRRRCSDLRAVGYIYDTGKRHRNTGSNDESIVWGITNVGKLAIRNLDRFGWSR